MSLITSARSFVRRIRHDGVRCIPEIRDDVLETQTRCREVTRETVKREKLRRKVMGFLMKVIAPLM
jgi:cardiolipin synthase